MMKLKSSVILLILSILFGMFLLGSCRNNSGAQGAWLYKMYCAPCHMDSGEGLAKLYPPLAQSDYLENNQDILPCIIRYGLHVPIVVNGVVYDEPMQGISELNDVEIHNIINYINTSWGNEIPRANFKETETRLSNCPK